MKFGEVMTLLESPDRVRIMQDGKEIYNQFFANLNADTETIEKFKDVEVKRFRLIPEIRHKQWKEKNLMPPLKPDETPEYSFSDLQLTIYHTIYI